MELRPGYKQTEIGVIPEDWEVAKLPDVLQFISGKAHERCIVEFGPYVAVNSKFISSDGEVVKYSKENFCPAKLDDILMVMSDLPNGKALAKCFIADVPNRYAVNQRVCILRSKGVDPNFFYYQLNRNPYFLAFDDGVSQTHLLNGVFLKCPVVVPPVLEQKAIAEALSDVDASIAALSRLIAKKRDLRQGAMQRLLTGQTRLPGFTAPWRERRLGELVNTDPENLGADTNPNLLFNYIALEDVDRGRLRGWTAQQFLSAPSRARRRLRDRDVLFATVRPNLQAHLLFNERSDQDTWVCSTGFCVLRCKSGVADPSFIFAQLFGPSIPVQIEKLIAGSNYPAVNSGDVRGLWIGAPEPDEQTAIARVLSDMDAELAALDARLDKTRALKQAMMQALLTGRVRLPVRRDAAPQRKEAAHG